MLDNYWIPLYKRIKMMMAKFPKMSRRKTTSKCGAIKRTAWFKTNSPTPYCSGKQEKIKRCQQSKKGLIQITKGA